MLNVITFSVVFRIVILSAGLLSFFALGVITLSVMILIVILSAIMLNYCALSVIILSFITLSVVFLIDILCHHAELLCFEFHLC